jgi:hypothetical protein
MIPYREPQTGKFCRVEPAVKQRNACRPDPGNTATTLRSLGYLLWHGFCNVKAGAARMGM